MNLQFPALRDILLFFGGLLGVAHEVILTNTERPTLLILFAAMMGLPAFLRADEVKAGKGGQTPQLPSPPTPPTPPAAPSPAPAPEPTPTPPVSTAV